MMPASPAGPARRPTGSMCTRRRPAALAALLVASSAASVSGMCPAGFGPGQNHPQEWAIPQWPETMSEYNAGKLRTVTLGGFTKEALNDEYLEGPTEEFDMQGRETYWQAAGQYFMYYCDGFQKWRIAGISAF